MAQFPDVVEYKMYVELISWDTLRVTRGLKAKYFTRAFDQFCDLSVYFVLTNLKSKTAQDNLPGQMNVFSTVSRRLIRNLCFTLGIFVTQVSVL